MEQKIKYGIGGYLKNATVVGFIGAALSSPLTYGLERIAQAGEQKKVMVKSMEAIFNDIGNKIEDGVLKRGTNSRGYRKGYESLNDAIDSIQEHSYNLGWDDKDMLRLNGFKVNAYMWQSKLLREAGNNIISDGERIVVNNLIDEHVNSKIKRSNRTYNLFKAIQDYQRVLDIWEEAKKHGKELPLSVDHGKLASYGTVARPDFVYEQMIQTINSLLGIAPEKYKAALKTKKAEIQGKFRN